MRRRPPLSAPDLVTSPRHPLAAFVATSTVPKAQLLAVFNGAVWSIASVWRANDAATAAGGSRSRRVRLFLTTAVSAPARCCGEDGVAGVGCIGQVITLNLWVANEICPLTATDLPAVVTTGRG